MIRKDETLSFIYANVDYSSDESILAHNKAAVHHHIAKDKEAFCNAISAIYGITESMMASHAIKDSCDRLIRYIIEAEKEYDDEIKKYLSRPDCYDIGDGA